MSTDMDDPFTTTDAPAPFSSLDPPPLLSLPASSPSQLKRTLEAHLQEVNKRIETAAALGRALLEQQQEIEARIQEVQEGGDQIGPELKKKLADLEKEYNEVGRESARAVLTNKVMAGPGGSSGGTSPFGTGNLSGTPSTLQSQGSGSPSKLSVPSRRQRNQPSRQHDLEFAAELGQGLLVEVRRLQSQLSERDEALKAVHLQSSSLERHAENLESRIKSLDESEQRFKEDNWNLELNIQELNAKAAEQKDTETKLHAQIAHMGHERNMVIKELDEWKHQNGKLYEDLEAEHKHHEFEISAMKKRLTTNETEQQELQNKIEELNQQLEESHKVSLRLRQMEHRSDGEDALKGQFSLQPTESTPENSPPPSPTKQTPRHAMLEAETVRSSLNHAHRMIANLKSNIHREKSEKAELKRLLQDARDELETARASLGNGPGSAGKRRKNDGLFRKPILRPNVNVNLLGGQRKSKDEVTLIEPPADGDWEEAPGESVLPNAPGSRLPDREQARSPSGATGTERDTDAFETADERGANATETEAYKTGNESPMADYPTSADELTETEANPQAPKAKSSRIPSFGVRPLRLTKIRHRDSVVSATSTEDDDDRGHRYGSFGTGAEDGPDDQQHDMMGTTHTGNPRLKLRINRARSRGSRITSESSLFSSRPFSAGSSTGGGSPASLNPKPPTGERKSLFAELGDSPMMGTDDGEDDEDEDLDEPDTPTKSFTRSVQMVDWGVMTEEPYPEQPLLRAVEEPERPRTAVAINNAPSTVSVGVQSEPEIVRVRMTDAAVQSLVEPEVIVNEMGTQSDGIQLPQMTEAGTQFDQELERGNAVALTPIPVVAQGVQATVVGGEMRDTETQFDPELEEVQKSLPTPVAIPLAKRNSEPISLVGSAKNAETQSDPTPQDTIPTKETEVVPAVSLEFSGIHSQDTIPIEPPAPIKSLGLILVPAPTSGADASASSDEETPKKVSETIEEAQQRPSTPSPTTNVGRPGFFGSVLSTWRRGGSVTSKPETSTAGIDKLSAESRPTPGLPSNQGTIPEQPQLPKAAPMLDQIVQTDISSDFFDGISKNAEKPIDKGKRPAYMVTAGETSINGDKTSARTSSLRSGPSQESISRTGVRVVGAGTVGSDARSQPSSSLKRPGSSSSLREHRVAHPPLPPDHKEHIAAAQQKITAPYDPSAMGPPPVPTAKSSVTFRPKTPVNDRIMREPETPGSRGGTTPRPRFSTTRSEVSSPTSRRSSLSSFASELDEKFNMQPRNAGGSPSGPENPTDPRMIQAITQTMIGEYLWKYTRNTGRSHSRHKRFFWVHPYTRTLYWSDRDPTTAGRAELRAKSVAIEAIRVVTDDNPLPPGLHRKSLIIVTPGRSLKFTAPTGQRHETWFNALSYLLLRTGELEDEHGVAADDVNDFNPGYGGAGRGAASVSSYNSRTTHASEPNRNASSLSNRRLVESSMRQGSMSRLSSIFGATSGFATFSSRSSRHNASIYNASEVNDSAEELRLEIEREEREADRLENVRACCDGKHDVSTLTRKGGRRSTQSARGRNDQNHHQPHKHNTVNGHERNQSHG